MGYRETLNWNLPSNDQIGIYKPVLNETESTQRWLSFLCQIARKCANNWANSFAFYACKPDVKTQMAF